MGHAAAHLAVGSRPRAGTAVARLTARLLRRGAVLLAAAALAYEVMEVRVFDSMYPDQASRELVAQFGQDPAVRIMAGVPAGSSIGALAVWDGGWMVQMIVGVWAVVTTARLLRGDEGVQRSELVLAGPLRARTVLGAQVAVLLAACGLVGAGVAVGLVAAGAEGVGGLLFGAEVAGFGATYVALTAALSQVFASRGRVAGVAATALAGAFLLRMVANSADSRSWLAWLTPLGWNDHLGPFGQNHWPVLLVPAAVSAALLAFAVVVRGRRDTGAGMVPTRAVERSRDVWLSSPLAFAWRTTAGTLVGWAVGLAALGVGTGSMLPSLEELVADDDAYADMMAVFGIDIAEVTLGYVAMMGVIAGVVTALYVTWRMGAARTEEDSGRLEQILVRPVPRWRWLGGHVLLAVVSAVLVAGAVAVATWTAARVVGADLSIRDAAAAGANNLPLVALFLGLAVFLLGVAPRLVVPVGASATLGTYVLNLLGPPLEWPDWVVAISPFHHVEMVPVDPFGTTAAVVMVGLAAVLVAVGMVAFERRDLVGS